MRITHTRLYATPDGESHFDELAADLAPIDFSPPAPPMNVSAVRAAAAVRFLSAPPGWAGEPHPSPRRQLFVGVSGAIEATTSDGQVRTFGAGDVLLMEDTTGKGHASRVVGPEPMLGVVVSLE